jgi:hypothetical protein
MVAPPSFTCTVFSKPINPCLTRACLTFPWMFSASLLPGCLVRNQRTRMGADTNDRGGEGWKSTTEDGMQSQVLASLSAKNNVLAHAAAAQTGAATMNNNQRQRDRKRNLMKEFVEEISRGSFGRAEAKGRIEKYKKEGEGWCADR